MRSYVGYIPLVLSIIALIFASVLAYVKISSGSLRSAGEIHVVDNLEGYKGVVCFVNKKHGSMQCLSGLTKGE